MLAITKIAEPGFQRGRVVLLDDVAVNFDGCMSRNRCPLARVVDEANVDRRVGLEIVGLSGLGVGMEEKVEAITLLCNLSNASTPRIMIRAYLCGQSHGSRRE